MIESKVKQLIRFLSVVLIAAVPLMSRPVYAASATMSLSPASSSVYKGVTFTVTIRENSGSEPVNGAQAYLTYPADLLDFVSIGDSSAFPVKAENSGGGGSVRITRGAFTPVTGSQTVATVRFKPKTDAGTAAINFASGSQVTTANGSGANILSGTSGATYALKATPPPAPGTPAAPKDTIPPTIKDVKAVDIKTNSATITWTTSEPTSSEVNYGLNNGYGLVAVDTNNVTEHKVVLSSPLIAAGTTFHFMVKSTDPGGNAASSSDNTFTTLGANLLITVVNQKNKKVSGAKVTLGDKKGTTNKNGQVTLNGFPLGKLVGTVDHKGKQKVVSTEIKTIDASGKAQPLTFKIETKANVWLLIFPLLLLLALAVLLARKDKLGKFGNLFKRPPRGGGSYGSSSSTPAASQSEPSIIRPTQPPKE